MNDEAALRMLRELKAESPRSHSSIEEAERAVRHVAFMDQVVRANRRRALVLPSALALAAAIALLLIGAFRQEKKLARAPEAVASVAVSDGSAPNRVTPISGSLKIEDNSAFERELSVPSTLLRGERVSLGAKAQAVVQLANGAQATLAESSSLTLEGTSGDPALRLTSGHVELSVPHLSPHSLSVVTSNARVTVVGTKFSVSVEAVSEKLARTCVNVTEGRVAVATASSNELLGAGAHWSSDGRECGGALAAPAAAGASAKPHALPTTPRAAVSAAPRTEPEEPAPLHGASLLAEQNRLFAAALRARQAGDFTRARALWGELLERFPDAALAPQARRELQKLEQATGELP